MFLLLHSCWLSHNITFSFKTSAAVTLPLKCLPESTASHRLRHLNYARNRGSLPLDNCSSSLTGLSSFALVLTAHFSRSNQSDHVKQKPGHVTCPWIGSSWLPRAVRVNAKWWSLICMALCNRTSAHSLTMFLLCPLCSPSSTLDQDTSSFLFKSFCSYYLPFLN